jgi:FkbM family methyltransferase
MTDIAQLQAQIERALLSRSHVGADDPMPASDASIDWVEGMISNGKVHDADYHVFGRLRDPATTVIDIGAHYGYSVGSIWSAGSKAAILTFEPNELYREALKRIGELRPGRHDVRMVALGSRRGELDMILPALDGKAVGALCTGAAAANPYGLAYAIANHIAVHGGDRLSLHWFKTRVERLDDALSAGNFRVPVSDVVAIKIDAEMMEGEILDGARQTLITHRPVVMIESGHNAATRAIMEELGFQMAEREGDRLRPALVPTQEVNGWFFHPDRLPEYTKLGLF